ncbi:hypothetical protein TSAR_004307 [Trichomalopsis sarcophagae]|uniref:Uncharacterized protein n=1 Tax=Trichomalopsis sarcophagae TaxID=543379 RepID=A0A232F6U2_9HYME|nr:hypothetical protein TSAR_004307 [Trichomalopsis sarcophagae]
MLIGGKWKLDYFLVELRMKMIKKIETEVEELTTYWTEKGIEEYRDWLQIQLQIKWIRKRAKRNEKEKENGTQGAEGKKTKRKEVRRKMSETKKLEERLEWALERIRELKIWMLEKNKEERREKEKWLKELKIKDEEIRELRNRIENLESKKEKITTIEGSEEESERDKKEKRDTKSRCSSGKDYTGDGYLREKIGEEWWWTEKVNENMLRIDFKEEIMGMKMGGKRGKLLYFGRVAKLKEREDRFHLIKVARELEEKKTEKNEKFKITLENKTIKIGEEWFKWNRKEGGLKKIIEEKDEEPLMKSWKGAMLCEMRMQEEKKKKEIEKKKMKMQEIESVEQERKQMEQKRIRTRREKQKRKERKI